MSALDAQDTSDYAPQPRERNRRVSSHPYAVPRPSGQQRIPEERLRANPQSESTAVAEPVDDFDRNRPVSQRPRQPGARETDPARLAARQRQLDMGKNTPEYDNYRRQVPK